MKWKKIRSIVLFTMVIVLEFAVNSFAAGEQGKFLEFHDLLF